MGEINLRARIKIEELEPGAIPYYRVLHDVEHSEQLRAALPVKRRLALLPWLRRLLSVIWRNGLPEVFPLNGYRTPFGADWQRLSFLLNPGMTGDKWRALYADNRAFTNGTGFNGDQPRADYVNGRDLGDPLPAWDKTRVCGGATITGIVDGPDLVVEIMDGHGPAPSLDWLLARPWLYFTAVNSTTNGVTNFPQNDGRPCIVPLVGSGVARISMLQLQRVPWIADPYYIGSRPKQ